MRMNNITSVVRETAQTSRVRPRLYSYERGEEDMGNVEIEIQRSAKLSLFRLHIILGIGHLAK